MGPASTETMMRGQIPPRPRLIGRNRMPAPTAVPNRLMTQWVSWRRQGVALTVVEQEPDSSLVTSTDKLITNSLFVSVLI